MNKNEDFITKGHCVPIEGEEFDYILVLDGHGDVLKQLMAYIRELDFDEIMTASASANECTATYLNNLINADKRFHIRAGCTFACAKIFSDRVVVSTVGDSNIYVYINNMLEYVSPDHNINNADEVARLESEGITYILKDDQTFKLVSPTSLTYDMAKSLHFTAPIKYVDYSTSGSELYTELYIAMTQTLGHHGITGLKPATKTIYFKPTDKVDVIVATDGVWDVIDPELNVEDKDKIIHLSAEDIAKEAVNRWKQGWDYIYNNETYSNTEFGPSGWDDVSVGVFRRYEIARVVEILENVDGETNASTVEVEDKLTTVFCKLHGM